MAIGVAEEMKEKYADRLAVKIHRMDSKEAESYRFRSSTNVLFDRKPVPVQIATDGEQMDSFLSSRIQASPE